MKLLITGAAGMLGVDVRAVGVAAGHEVVALSRAELDIADDVAVRRAFRELRPDVVINCAAFTKVDGAEEDIPGAIVVNTLGPAVLGVAAAEVGAWVVHVSTDYVFDGSKISGAYVESDGVGPRSVYGSTKLGGEQALAAALPEAHTIVRSSWLFGLGGPCFPATILRVAASRPEMKVVDDQIGSPTFTPHLAAALLRFAERRDVVGVTHVAAAGETSWFGFASAILDAVRAEESDGGVRSDWATLAPCSTAEYPLPAPRPAFSVMRSEREGVPVLPAWREGLAEYMSARAVDRAEVV